MHLAGAWPDVLRRRAALGRAIRRWLPGRRWFVGKGAVLRDLTVEDVIELSGSVAFAVVRTSFTEGDDHLYSVPLLHATAGRAEELEHRRPGSVIAVLDDGAIVDAMVVPEGAGVVAGAALRRRTRRGQDVDGDRSPAPAGVDQAGRRPPRRARAQRRADEHVGDPRRPGHRQADPPPRPRRQPRRHAPDAPALAWVRARAGRRRHARRPARRRRAGERRRRPRRRRQRGRPVGVEPGPADPRGRATGVRAGVDRRRRGDGGGHRPARPSARPRCTSASPAVRRGSSRSGSRCCTSARSCRACGRRCARPSGSSRRSRTAMTPQTDAMAAALARRRRPAAPRVRRAAHAQARRRAHPRPRRPAPRPGAVDRARRRVHRLRGRARPADRRALDQALAVQRRRRDRPLARLRRARRAGDVDRARPGRRDAGRVARAVAAGVDASG